MALKITTGQQAAAVRVVIYGIEGIGKTTLAAQFPKALIIDTEDGSKRIDCSRHAVKTWDSLKLAIAGLVVDPQGFETVVIDSADWAEKLLIESILKETGKKSIEDFGFGKGYVRLAENISEFLRTTDKLVANGVNVVFCAHSTVKRTSPPDQTDGYDRYELKLTKQVAPLFKEWCDLLLFCNYKTRLVEGADGRLKAQGGKVRIMHSSRSAAWDAKNRYGLPEEMPMAVAELEPMLSTRPAASAPSKVSTQARASIEKADDVAGLEQIRSKIDARLIKGDLSPAEAFDLLETIETRRSHLEAESLATQES